MSQNLGTVLSGVASIAGAAPAPPSTGSAGVGGSGDGTPTGVVALLMIAAAAFVLGVRRLTVRR